MRERLLSEIVEMLLDDREWVRERATVSLEDLLPVMSSQEIVRLAEKFLASLDKAAASKRHALADTATVFDSFLTERGEESTARALRSRVHAA